ncbi:MBL fold metallo-hydrolase [Candidatus Woesearchaeota archaeon]|nr:MBL fold metallo-hydrolase [Candidatus Woesearchaeota archaeon]
MRLTWFGHHSFRIEYADKALYLDPYAGEQEWYDRPANLVLISKDDYDHWSRALLAKISIDGTHVFGPPDVSRDILGCKPFTPGESLTFEDNTMILATEATARTRTTVERSLGWLLVIEGRRVYFAGDTGTTQNLLNIKADVVIIPVGTLAMPAKAAADAVKIIKPRLAIPTHYGRLSGTLDDAELFKELVETSRETQVVILEPGKAVEF